MPDHIPVLLNEVLEHLAIKPNGIYIDGTFGRGGHSKEIFARLDQSGALLALDKDAEALASVPQYLQQDPRFYIEQDSFTSLHQQVIAKQWMGKVDGILLDLGVSSPQLDDAHRGFSFTKDGPLDMRMDHRQTLSAVTWINTAETADIAEVLKKYGEERYAKRIAQHIVTERERALIKTTEHLADIVTKANPRWELHKHPATRVFQAIRIFINDELAELTAVLPQTLDILKIGGRLLVISFHSLEDRIVKDFLNVQSSTAHLPRGLPLTQIELQAHVRLKKINSAIRASQAEINQNPRSRSAILRVMEKVK